MDWVKAKEKIEKFIGKYKFVLVIFLAGIVLMILPINETENTKTQIIEEKGKVENVEDAEIKLAQILTKINGVGEVKVMLTLASGERTVYQTDMDSSADQNGSSNRIDTVIINGSDRGESGLVTQIESPKYLGAIIVCQGADDPAVRLSVVDAVSKAMGLGADKISVLKMK